METHFLQLLRVISVSFAAFEVVFQFALIVLLLMYTFSLVFGKLAMQVRNEFRILLVTLSLHHRLVVVSRGDELSVSSEVLFED